jgi:SsrA-binding protein
MAKKLKFKELENKAAYYNFFIDDKYVAGLVLQGTEVKSIRMGRVSFNDAYCQISDGEMFVKSLHISEYIHGQNSNHNPTQDRKLLLNKKEIRKIAAKMKEKGFTVIPTRFFENEDGRIKLEISLARGKKLYDKRDTIKKRDSDRELKSGKY